MKSYKIIKILLSSILIIFVFLLFDLLINIILPENLKKKIGTTRNYSLKSTNFHHEIAPNINLYEHWGSKKYKVVTNKFGMAGAIDLGEKDFDLLAEVPKGKVWCGCWSCIGCLRQCSKDSPHRRCSFRQ